MSLYKLSNIKKVYDRRTVLDVKDLSLEDGSIYTLTGGNGAGKTTLLNILSFLERPSQGEIFWDGVRVKPRERELRSLRRQVGFLDQNPLLFSTTVFKNLEYGLKIRRVPASKRKELIDEALGLVGMLGFRDKSAINLSGGETRRVALARAFVLEPRVLLCDEPTANVDAETQLLLVELLKKINQTRGIAIVFSTHDKTFAAELAQKTIHLKDGLISADLGENNFRCFC